MESKDMLKMMEEMKAMMYDLKSMMEEVGVKDKPETEEKEEKEEPVEKDKPSKMGDAIKQAKFKPFKKKDKKPVE